VLTLSGKLDTVNSSLLERKIKQWDESIKELILDFTDVTYISSVGLRVLLHEKKVFKKEIRKLTIQNLSDSVREVFEMTGFLKLMVQEEHFVLIRKNEPDGIVLSFNGEMQAENIAALSKELSEISEAANVSEANTTVVFDMANLGYTTPHVCKHFAQAVIETACAKRTIKLLNAPSEIREVLENEGVKIDL